MDSVQQVDIEQIDEKHFKHRYVGCVVVTQDNKILLQQRESNISHYPGYLSEFGGRIEAGESPMQALTRELKEELGADVDPADVVSFGAIIEKSAERNELIYVYFWRDKNNTIKGCYEGEARYFDNLSAIFDHPKVTDGLRWLLNECQKRQLLHLKT